MNAQVIGVWWCIFLFITMLSGSSDICVTLTSIGSLCNMNQQLLIYRLRSLICFPLILQEKERVEAVSVGAILSDYQRVRVENV